MSTPPAATASHVPFTTGAIRPAQCLREGWALIREAYGTFLAITFVGLLIAGLGPMGVLVGPGWCGIYYALFRRVAGEPPRFEMLFKGFDWFVPSLIITLIQVGITLVLMVPFAGALVGGIVAMAAAAERNPGGEVPTWVFVLFFVAIALTLLVAMSVACLFLFSYQLLVDRNLAPVDCLKTSARATWANLGGVAGLLLLNSLVAIAGLLCCIVGIYLVMPVIIAAQLVAYRAVFPPVAEPA